MLGFVCYRCGFRLISLTLGSLPSGTSRSGFWVFTNGFKERNGTQKLLASKSVDCCLRGFGDLSVNASGDVTRSDSTRSLGFSHGVYF